jgi:hypothetical protein
MTRLHHLIKHPPSPSMSARQEVRLLSKQLRKLENKEPTPETINLMLRLSQRIGVLRKQINPPVKRPVGRPRVKPVEPEVVVNETWLDAVLEAEKQRRETPEPSIVFEHARRAEVKAEIKKEREAVENPPITAPQSDVQEVGDGEAPSKQPEFIVASQGLLNMFRVVSRHGDGDEHDGSVGMTNALLRDFERAPEPHEQVGEGGYLVDWAGNIKPRT